MNLSKQLAKRFREVILDGKFIAFTNFKEQIADLDWKQATTKIGSLNTPAALTFHINYYVEGVLNLFENGKLEISDKYSYDMPEVATEEDWMEIKNALLGNAEKFASHVERMTNEDLASIFVDEKYGDYLRNIEGMIEHCYYHFGQLVIINKLIREGVGK